MVNIFVSSVLMSLGVFIYLLVTGSGGWLKYSKIFFLLAKQQQSSGYSIS